MRTTGILIVLVVYAAILKAQPSGGPYGPIQQNYAVPEIAGTVYFAAPDGNADALGTSVDNPTTIEAAVNKAITGDAIVLRGGTYRTGNLIFNQGITLQPYKEEQPVFKGTKVASRLEKPS